VQGLLLIALGVLLALGLYTGTTGPVGELLADITGWLVGRVRYVAPLGLFWLGWHRLRTAPTPRSRSRRKKAPRFEPAQLAAGALVVAAVFSILDLVGGRPWNGATVDELSDAGGHVGVRIGGTLESLFGHWGHIIVTVTMVLVGVTVLTSISYGWILDAIISRLRQAAGYVAETASNIDFDRSKLGFGNRSAPEGSEPGVIEPLMDLEITTASDGPGLRKSKETAEKYIDLRPETVGFDDLPTARPDPPDETMAADAPIEIGTFEDPSGDHFSFSQVEAPSSQAEAAPISPTPEGGEWMLPSVGILELSASQDVDETEVRSRGLRLQRALQEHGVETRLIGVRVGPTISMFEYELAPKTKVSRVMALRQDIAYAMMTPNVRILAPIPGKQAIGVEVPNLERGLVTVGDLLVSDEARKAKHPLEVGLGRDITGRTIMINLAKMPHLLVAGQTGSGKSSGLNTMLTSILMRSTPEQVRLILVDPKRVELTQYNGLPHLLSEVVTDPKKASNALNWGVREMERRYSMLEEVGVRDISGYNQAVEDKRLAPRVMDDGSLGDYEKFSFVLIVIDELADLMMQVGAEIEESIVRIAQKARAVGIHLVIATQRPSTNVITGMIKANVPARLAYAVSSLTDSRVVLDAGGAENLVGKGDGLISDGSTSDLTRFQGAWVTEEEVAKIVDFWRHQAPDVQFDPRVQGDDAEVAGAAAVLPGGTTGSADDDELLLAAMELVVNSQRAAVSDFQRKLRVGFARAGRLMDELEQRGIVGPNLGSKVRDVLVTPADLHKMAGAVAPAPVPHQQQLITPPLPKASEPKPTLASIQNPIEPPTNERSKALPRPLSELEKQKQEADAAESKIAAEPEANEDRDIVDHAAELIINSQLGSVPMLQRKLRVELKEAERVMNVLEERGIVGPAQGVRAREVLMKPEDAETADDASATAAKPAGKPKKVAKPKKQASRTSPAETTEQLDLTDSPVDLTGESDTQVAGLELDTPDVASHDDDDFATDDDFDPALAPPPGYPKPRQ
jgi:S-DNA-T family DNA segregation ATPase FtsK/SpoIIIE